MTDRKHRHVIVKVVNRSTICKSRVISKTIHNAIESDSLCIHLMLSRLVMMPFGGHKLLGISSHSFIRELETFPVSALIAYLFLNILLHVV